MRSISNNAEAKKFKYSPAADSSTTTLSTLLQSLKQDRVQRKLNCKTSHAPQFSVEQNNNAMQLLLEIVSIAYGRYVLTWVLIHRDVMIHITRDSASCS
jgi:hypothetical protein